MIKLTTIAMSCALLIACGDGGNMPPPPSPTASAIAAKDIERRKEAAETERIKASEECKSSLATRLVEYKKLLAAKEYWPASVKVRRCSQLLDDEKLKTLLKDAEVKAYLADLQSTKNSANDRLQAYERLDRDYPDQSKKFTKLYDKLRSDAEFQKKKDWYDNRFSRQVRIGDTQNSVVTSGWGYPSKINKTTTANGVREQWVYGDGKYLYFDNGILGGIQE